ncbi:MBL fold metallo-hydrolase [candidate division WOR-3 bacterium]|nr:MBL fold metallo-hydrolase [candidate division WOR-3 bacterium]
MVVTIIYDNEVYKNGLQSDWGFSAVLDIENTPRILFDTGTDSDILLSNMEKLNIDPTSIDEVFISHFHHDHTGGLTGFLKINNDITLYIPSSYPKPPGVKEVVTIKEPIQIHENVFSTGELDRIEQALAVKTDKGIIIIVGCSHPEMQHILDAASRFGPIYGIIGGVHGFREFELFDNLKIICTTHCTQYKREIKDLYPEVYIDGGVGRVISI